jgi:hypothetical protein
MTPAAELTDRHYVVLMAYQALAVYAAPDIRPDKDGNRWGATVYLDDMWPLIVGDVNGRDETLAVVLDLAARTEGEFSSVVTDEFGETRIVFERGILGGA